MFVFYDLLIPGISRFWENAQWPNVESRRYGYIYEIMNLNDLICWLFLRNWFLKQIYIEMVDLMVIRHYFFVLLPKFYPSKYFFSTPCKQWIFNRIQWEKGDENENKFYFSSFSMMFHVCEYCSMTNQEHSFSVVFSFFGSSKQIRVLILDRVKLCFCSHNVLPSCAVWNWYLLSVDSHWTNWKRKCSGTIWPYHSNAIIPIIRKKGLWCDTL